MVNGDEYDPTPEEYKLYVSQVQETEGFDVDDILGVFMLGQIRPIDIEDEDESEKSLSLTMIAIQEFNQRRYKGMVLEFEELLAATYQIVAGFLFRLTFKAKDIANGGKSETYQAVVYDRCSKKEKPEVSSFRRKPTGLKKEKWIWQTHLDGCGCLGDCDCVSSSESSDCVSSSQSSD